MKLYLFLLFCFSTTSLSTPTPLPSLPESIVSKFMTLTDSARSVALSQLEKINNYDTQRMELDNSGKFFVIEDPVHLAPEDDTYDKTRRTISGNPPTGVKDGVPIFHSYPGSPNVIYLNFLGGFWLGRHGMMLMDCLPSMRLNITLTECQDFQ